MAYPEHSITEVSKGEDAVSSKDGPKKYFGRIIARWDGTRPDQYYIGDEMYKLVKYSKDNVPKKYHPEDERTAFDETTSLEEQEYNGPRCNLKMRKINRISNQVELYISFILTSERIGVWIVIYRGHTSLGLK